MGIKERKVREKEAFRQLVISTALDILIEEGLGNLTLRGIANRIEYSQSKIYECFRNKDHLCEVVCEKLCVELLKEVELLPQQNDPAEHLADLIKETLHFHQTHPHSDELFTLVCYCPERFTLPQTFRKIEGYFTDALIKLQSPYIRTPKEVDLSLDAIRCFFIGISTLANAKSSHERLDEIIETAIRILVRGMK